MNRNNQLERHLLTRNFDDSDHINELLETRYSITGDQKPSLVLLPTGEDPEKVHSLLHEEPKLETDPTYTKRRTNTRNEVKTYLQNTIRNQKKVTKLIQDYNRKAKKQHPFPVEKLIKHYNIPTYEEFKPINELWNQYASEVAFSKVKEGSNQLPSIQTVLSGLSSAELNGCLITVIKSRNANIIGTKGIIVYDTQYSFIVCIDREGCNSAPAKQVGGLRMIPKAGNLFSFEVKIPQTEEEIAFTIIGSRMEFRPVDRSTKKFKNHNVGDI